MHKDTLIDDLRAAFATQAESMPLPPNDAQPRYRPRTSPTLLLPAGVALGSLALASAAVAAALASGSGLGTEAPTAVGPAPTSGDGRLTLDLSGYRITLPEGYRLSSGTCDVEPPPNDLDIKAIRKVVNRDGTCVSIYINGKPFAPPEGARPVTVGGYQGWATTEDTGIGVGFVVASPNGNLVLLVFVKTVAGQPTVDEVVASLADITLTWQASVTSS